MLSDKARTDILSKLKKASSKLTEDLSDDVLDADTKDIFVLSEKNLLETFRSELLNVSGDFFYISNEHELIPALEKFLKDEAYDFVFCRDSTLLAKLKNSAINYSNDEQKFLDTKFGLTTCEYLIAQFGSVMVSSALESGRRLNVYPEIHIVISYQSQLLPDLKSALKKIKQKYQSGLPSQITVITGPSRTADIEKTLVLGAHGPKKIVVFLINDL